MHPSGATSSDARAGAADVRHAAHDQSTQGHDRALDDTAPLEAEVSAILKASSGLVQWSPCGQYLALAHGSRLVIRERSTLQIVQQYSALDAIQSIAWSDDSQLVSTAMYKRAIVQVALVALIVNHAMHLSDTHLLTAALASLAAHDHRSGLSKTHRGRARSAKALLAWYVRSLIQSDSSRRS